MKYIIQYISISIVFLLVFSCNDDFLTKESSSEPYLGESSPIFISPDWTAKDYSINGWNTGNARFTVTHVPSWLKISSLSGQFTNNNASLNCKANYYSLFPEIGFYSTYIFLSIENQGRLVVPVVYMVEGTPVIEVPSRLTIDENNEVRLPIKNTGNGILTWSVLELPEWLSIKENYGVILYASIPVSALHPNGEAFIILTLNNITPSENLTGKIVLTTNDKNNPEIEIEVQMDYATP